MPRLAERADHWGPLANVEHLDAWRVVIGIRGEDPVELSPVYVKDQ